EFRVDMCRQIWDEARHANLAWQRCQELGGVESHWTFTGVVWKKWASATTIEERLAVQQIVQEGNGLDAAAHLAAAFRSEGDCQTAEMLDVFTADESIHAGFGNKWLLRRIGGDEALYGKL